MKQTELAWAAGFFDGEGCTGAQLTKWRDKQYLYLRMSIGQVDLSTLERFKAAVGVGNIGNAYQPKEPNRQKIFKYRANSKDALIVIEKLWPFLSEPKRNQITKAQEKINASRTI